MAWATWNPLDKDAGITLSNLDYTATIATGFSYRGARGTVPKTTGKVHVEFKGVHNVGTPNWSIGIANTTANLIGYMGTDNNSIGAYRDGTVWRNNSSQGVGASGGFVQNVWAAVEIDFDAKTLRYWNGTVWGTAFSFSAVTGPYLLFWSADTNTCTADINTGQSAFVITPNANFESGWASAAVVTPGPTTTGGSAFWDQDYDGREYESSRKRRKRFLDERARRVAELE